MAGTKCAFLLLALVLWAGGCGPKSGADTEVVVRINDYAVTRGEFDSEYKDSVYGAADTPESRQKFLNALIDRKLILQYAQREGFDKETQFLKTLERFWEQSLLKVALDRKTIEITAKTSGASWEVQRAEETKKMNDWMADLRKTARITVREDSLTGPATQKGGQ